MFHEIFPHRFDISYEVRQPVEADCILHFHGSKVLLKEEDGPALPRLTDMNGCGAGAEFLFSIDGAGFFALRGDGPEEGGGLRFFDVRSLLDAQPEWMAFAVATAGQLNRWMEDNRFCGKCGGQMRKSESERALCCGACGGTVYPKIAPAIMAGIIDRERGRMLHVKYAAGGYAHYAMVAGYVEAGESLEDTVRREVMEEVGLSVKNIRYYKSQPWGLTDALMIGFFADLDGPADVTLDETELSEGTWFRADQAPESPESISLSHDMMAAFRRGEA